MSRRLLVLVALAGVCGCRPSHGPPRVKKLPKRDETPALRGGGAARSPRIASYTIDAKLDDKRHAITATETLIWTNSGASPVDSLPLHLYLNAFKNESSVFMRESRGQMRGAHASESGWGYLQLESVTVGGVELLAKLEYPHLPDETVVEIPLPQPVAAGQAIEVQLKFTAQLPEVWARTGYKGDFHLVGQWYPKIGVRGGPPGAETWDCPPYHARSEYYADFGTYDVSLTVPATHVVAATGVLKSATDIPGQLRTFVYHAEDVHDFAWMADPFMVVDATGKTPFSGKAKVDDGEVEVRVYARKEQAAFARRHLQAAIGAVERFSAYLLPYPWPILTIVDPPMDAVDGAGAMEYPTFVTTGGDSVFMRPGMRLPELVTIHEVGHSWFQSMLASNEGAEPWLDEAVNEWMDVRVMRDLYGPRKSGLDWFGFQADAGALHRAWGDDPSTLPGPIATAAYAFVDSDAYDQQTYYTATRALMTLEGIFGSTKVLAATKAYAREQAFKHPTGRDFYAALEREIGENLGWFFEPVFQRVGGVKLAVRKAVCDKAHAPRGVFGDSQNHKTVTETEAPDTGTFVCEVVIQNTGVVHVPVDVELVFADGTSQRLQWDDRGNGSWQRFVVERSSELVEVRIDPDDKIALANPIGHQVRVDGDGSASLRAAARISFWAQSLMQLVGP